MSETKRKPNRYRRRLAEIDGYIDRRLTMLKYQSTTRRVDARTLLIQEFTKLQHMIRDDYED